MTFRDLKVGDWFDFVRTTPFSGSPFGPFKKTGKRNYIYRHQHGWFETRISTISAAVVEMKRPASAPAELVDILINFNDEIGAYLVSALVYATRDVEQAEELEIDDNVFYEKDGGKRSALNRAVKRAKEHAESKLTHPIEAEEVVILVAGNEHLVGKSINGKAAIACGAFHPRRTRSLH